MELMVKGSLLGLFENHSDEIDEPRLFAIAKDIAQGMAYLSNRGFVHRYAAAWLFIAVFSLQIACMQ
jgi:serine/threonine protein kinase